MCFRLNPHIFEDCICWKHKYKCLLIWQDNSQNNVAMRILLETNDTNAADIRRVIYGAFHRVLNDDSSRFVWIETDDGPSMDMLWHCAGSLH